MLGLGRLADLLVQLRLDSTRMYNPAITFRNPWGERRFGPGGDLHGIAFKSNPSGCSTQMLEATARGRNIRRVDVKRGGAVVASFYLKEGVAEQLKALRERREPSCGTRFHQRTSCPS